jgi:hypothetical protein
MRRAEQLSKVADPFANPLRGGVMEVEMRTLLLCVFFLGCQSSPALYEIIEVKNGQEVRDMHGWNRGVWGGSMPKVPRLDGAWGRPDFDFAQAREEDPSTSRALLGQGRTFSTDRR